MTGELVVLLDGKEIGRVRNDARGRSLLSMMTIGARRRMRIRYRFLRHWLPESTALP
jgi:hypothetical protein